MQHEMFAHPYHWLYRNSHKKQHMQHESVNIHITCKAEILLSQPLKHCIVSTLYINPKNDVLIHHGSYSNIDTTMLWCCRMIDM